MFSKELPANEVNCYSEITRTSRKRDLFTPYLLQLRQGYKLTPSLYNASFFDMILQYTYPSPKTTRATIYPDRTA